MWELSVLVKDSAMKCKNLCCRLQSASHFPEVIFNKIQPSHCDRVFQISVGPFGFTLKYTETWRPLPKHRPGEFHPMCWELSQCLWGSHSLEKELRALWDILTWQIPSYISFGSNGFNGFLLRFFSPCTWGWFGDTPLLSSWLFLCLLPSPWESYRKTDAKTLWNPWDKVTLRHSKSG